MKLRITFMGGYAYIFQKSSVTVGALKDGLHGQPFEFREHRFLTVLNEGSFLRGLPSLGGRLWDLTGCRVSVSSENGGSLVKKNNWSPEYVPNLTNHHHPATVTHNWKRLLGSSFVLNAGEISPGQPHQSETHFKDRTGQDRLTMLATSSVVYELETTAGSVVLQVAGLLSGTIELAPSAGNIVELVVGDPSDHRDAIDDSPDFRGFYGLLPQVAETERVGPFHPPQFGPAFPGEFCIPAQFDVS